MGLVYCVVVCVSGLLGGLGLLSPFTAGMAALGLGNLLGMSRELTIAMVVGCYVSSFISVTRQEASGYSLDLAQQVGADSEPLKASKEAVVDYWWTVWLKGILLIVFTFLPLGRAPGYLPIWAAAGLGVFLVIANWNQEEERASLGAFLTACVSQGVLLWGVMWIGSLVGVTGNPVIAIFAATCIPGLFIYTHRKKETPQDSVHIPPWVVVLVGALSLMTAGLTLGVICVGFVPSGRTRVNLLGRLEACFLGWNLHLNLVGESTSKTGLANILLAPTADRSPLFVASQDLVGSTISQVVIVAIVIGLIGAAVGIYFSSRMIEPTGDVKRVMYGAALFMQCVISSGGWAFIYVLAGFACVYLRLWLAPNQPDSRGLSLFVPMLMP